ncbi:MAG: hypothetical protein MI741_09875 [Rhodospirillales bacterium]|nr:hypothetical protein [Rhodospirillales bacterium]
MAFLSPEAEAQGHSNLEMPTLGGKQVWRDVYVHARWRIQQNVLTGHHRLLDPADRRHAWGGFEETLRRFQTIRAEKGIGPRSRHLVMLVHGIGPVLDPFAETRKRLLADGFDVVGVSYPSTRGTIQSHARGLSRVLDRLEGTETVSFVTHSMGGLVVRHLLAGDASWKEKLKVGHLVMIAPPNRGAAIARFLRDFPPYEFLYGEAGQQLIPAAVQKVPRPAVPFIVIAGGRGDGRGFNPFLEGDDDGTVSVAETLLPGADAHYVVPAIHSTVAGHPEALRITLSFLQPATK